MGSDSIRAMPLASLPKAKPFEGKTLKSTADERLWLKLYFDITNTDYLKTHGHGNMIEMRLICFQKVLELFGMSSKIEKMSPGFVNIIFSDFEIAIFNSDNNVIRNILEQTTYFTLHLWRMCLEIGDFIMQHRVFLMTSYFMHLSSRDRVVRETIELDKLFGGVFAGHLLENLPTPANVEHHMMCSRKFLNILNISRGINTKVISIEATKLKFHRKEFHASEHQKNVWIDFNFHERYVSVWCTKLVAGKQSKTVETNLIFKVNNIIMGVFSSIMTIEAIPPIQVRAFNKPCEYLAAEDVLSFTLTDDGFRMVRVHSDKLNEIETRKPTYKTKLK